MCSTPPKINIPLTKQQQKLIVFGWIIVVLNFLLVAAFYNNLNDIVPIHFNYKGEADGYGNKQTIWALPILTLIVHTILYLVLKKTKPWNMNYPIQVTAKNAPQLYRLSIHMLVQLNLLIAIMLIPIILETIILDHNLNLGFKLSSLTLFIVACITVLPFYYVFKMYKIPKE
ncbi:DUF1648 domain-containing protein [Maribacter confluentis]|uniref:DUF1648 domain-containing protein n=1 Tax=Maribacter confluentis TaxID=1656093 RepID=A0ABT8RRU0_9FLAO|nr:DUF1648 domain-containing protein [Maribacter confluentis]MDO1513633.1 DUF1648 domain-containing protein [Maribacter confluentis]